MGHSLPGCGVFAPFLLSLTVSFCWVYSGSQRRSRLDLAVWPADWRMSSLTRSARWETMIFPLKTDEFLLKNGAFLLKTDDRFWPLMHVVLNNDELLKEWWIYIQRSVEEQQLAWRQIGTRAIRLSRICSLQYKFHGFSNLVSGNSYWNGRLIRSRTGCSDWCPAA